MSTYWMAETDAHDFNWAVGKGDEEIAYFFDRDMALKFKDMMNAAKPKTPAWPRGWIFDRPFLSGSKRFRVVIQRCDEEGSIARYADNWQQAYDWLIENGVHEHNIESTTRPF